MNDSLTHRGPDDAGRFVSGIGSLEGHSEIPPQLPEPTCCLAMRRLSIIDLSGGHQPLSTEDGRFWIVFNGEIYNYRSLRNELEQLGARFRTHSDTEVALLAYRHWGRSFLDRLRGMFALAIWNQDEGSLLLARDPFGIKPLFYTIRGERLLFASEIKALLRYPGVARSLNREALPDLLSFLYVPAPATLFSDIRQLRPGEAAEWRGGKLDFWQYWSTPAPGGCQPTTPERVLEVLSDSIQAHLVSDVEVGAFLSGGIDSSLLVALVRELTGRSLKTFSIGFPESGMYDESVHARKVAEFLGTEHHEFAVEPGSAEELPQILRALDEPLANPSVIPNYELARATRKYCKVALSGIGGDELFGGYRRYFAHQFAPPWQVIPRCIRSRVLLPALRTLPAGGASVWQDRVRLLEKFLVPLDLPRERRYIAWNSHFTEEEKRRLFREGRVPGVPSYQRFLPYFEPVRDRQFGDQLMYVDLRTYLPGDSLFLADRLTMAHSLEARVPFVDLKVVDFAATIPFFQKIQGMQTKKILRAASADKLPESILARPKQGFGTPVDLWLRRDLSFLTRHLLGERSVRERGIFDPDSVQALVAQQRAGGRDSSQQVWILLMLELWHRMYIDQDLSNDAAVSFSRLGIRR
ncbi:MAG: asparagine synthetase B [Candidatus Xenobia bacterium]